ncbi:MAG TPA: hypothetical protein VFA28_01875 [Bryobacteraceae bacterium]|jgi:hypothetical protein|nr:hypothetical protein [Bryobacteraceae bacterium]
MMDRIDPRRYNQFRNPYHRRALIALEPLRKALGYEPRHEVIPNQQDAVIAKQGVYDHRVTVPAGTWLWGLAGTSQQPEGFSVHITDFATKATLWSGPINYVNLTGQGSVTVQDPTGANVQIATPLHLLNKPRPIIEPGLLNVQVVNLSATNTNKIQLVLYMLRPPEAGGARNVYNTELEAELDLWRSVVTAAVGTPANAAAPAIQQASLPNPIQRDPALDAPAKNQPFNVAAAGDNVLIAGVPGYRIAVHQLSLWNVVAQNVRLLDGLGGTDLQGPLTDFGAGNGYFLPYQAEPHFVLGDGHSLVANLAAGTAGTQGAITGFAKYRLLKQWGG